MWREQQRLVYISFFSARCERAHTNQVSRIALPGYPANHSRLVPEVLPNPAQDPHLCAR